MKVEPVASSNYPIFYQPVADPSAFNGDFLLVLLSFVVLMAIPAAILTGYLLGFSAKGSPFSIDRMEKENKQARIFGLAWLVAMFLGFIGTRVLTSKFDFRYWPAVSISTVSLTLLGLAVGFFGSLKAKR